MSYSISRGFNTRIFSRDRRTSSALAKIALRPPALQENLCRTLYQWLGLTSVIDTHASGGVTTDPSFDSSPHPRPLLCQEEDVTGFADEKREPVLPAPPVDERSCPAHALTGTVRMGVGMGAEGGR